MFEDVANEIYNLEQKLPLKQILHDEESKINSIEDNSVIEFIPNKFTLKTLSTQLLHVIGDSKGLPNIVDTITLGNLSNLKYYFSFIIDRSPFESTFRIWKLAAIFSNIGNFVVYTDISTDVIYIEQSDIFNPDSIFDCYPIHDLELLKDLNSYCKDNYIYSINEDVYNAMKQKFLQNII